MAARNFKRLAGLPMIGTILKTFLEELFHATDGHNHDGTTGNGATLSAYAGVDNATIEEGAGAILQVKDGGILAAQLGVTAGANSASKALVAGTTKNLDTLLIDAATLVATGNSQGTAAAIVSDTVYVTAADNTTSVKLPTAVSGRRIVVINTVANKVLPIYPATGASINAESANAAVSLPAGSVAVFYATSATKWYGGIIQNGVTATAAEINQLAGVVPVLTTTDQTIEGTKTFAAVPKTSAGNGAVVAAKASAVEYGEGLIHQTVLTFTLTGANDLDMADSAAHGTGVKVYDFPEGRILLLGATVNAVLATTGVNATPNNVVIMGIGSRVQTDDATLDAADVDIIPATNCAITTNAGTFKAALAASAHFDGTTTPLDLFVNAGIIDANSGAAVTLAVTGTATLTWINLGDY